MPTSANSAPSSVPPLIAFRDVGLTIGEKTIVEHLDMDIRSGEFVCVIGPSGCGKTTTLRLIANLLSPTAGTLTLDGAPIREPRADVAIVFQDYGKALLPWRSVGGNISLALEAMNVAKSERADRISSLLKLVGLSAHIDKFPGQLSGGQQQRLQIARSLAQNPRVLLMDEPFGALDAMTRQSLQDEMLSIVERSGTTVFFVTHDLEEAIYLGDRVIGLYANPGRVGKVFDVPLPRPRHQLYTREMPEFLKLRHELFEFIEAAEHEAH